MYKLTVGGDEYTLGSSSLKAFALQQAVNHLCSEENAIEFLEYIGIKVKVEVENESGGK